jgi:hypothetical protein
MLIGAYLDGCTRTGSSYNFARIKEKNEMAMNLNMNEKMALYMFGCGKLQRSIGNLHGTTALATGRKAMRMQNQLVDMLENYNLTDAEYEDAFYHVRLDISKSMTEAHLLYQKMTGDVENDYPWRYFVKAVIFENFCGRNLSHASLFV